MVQFLFLRETHPIFCIIEDRNVTAWCLYGLKGQTTFLKRKHAALAIKSDYACLSLLQVFILTHEMKNKILFIIRKLQSSENAVTDRLAAKAINVKQLTWSIHVVLASSFLIILSWWINLSLRGPSPFICVEGLTLG